MRCRNWPATSSRFDLRPRPRGVRVGALGAPGGGAARVAEPAGGDARGAPRRGAVARRRRATSGWSTRHGEVFEANLGDVEDEDLSRWPGPEGSSAQVLAMQRRLRRHAGAARRAHRDAETVEPRLVARRARQRRRARARPRQRRRGGGARGALRAHVGAGHPALCRRRRHADADRRRPAPPRRLRTAAARRIDDHRWPAAKKAATPR